MIEAKGGMVKLSGISGMLLMEFSSVVTAMSRLDGVSNDDIRKAFEMGFKSDEELEKEAAERALKLFGKIMGSHLKDDDSGWFEKFLGEVAGSDKEESKNG